MHSPPPFHSECLSTSFCHGFSLFSHNFFPKVIKPKFPLPQAPILLFGLYSTIVKTTVLEQSEYQRCIQFQWKLVEIISLYKYSIFWSATFWKPEITLAMMVRCTHIPGSELFSFSVGLPKPCCFVTLSLFQ